MKKVGLLSENLDCEISDISIPVLESKVIASTVEIHEENIHDSVYAMLFHRDMPAIKVFDYLSKYHKRVTMYQIDELLDLYSVKTKTKTRASNV